MCLLSGQPVGGAEPLGTVQGRKQRLGGIGRTPIGAGDDSEVIAHQGTHRSVALRGSNTRQTIGLFVHGQGDVLHGRLTVTQLEAGEFEHSKGKIDQITLAEHLDQREALISVWADLMMPFDHQRDLFGPAFAPCFRQVTLRLLD
jgi:hypothetical protein